MRYPTVPKPVRRLLTIALAGAGILVGVGSSVAAGDRNEKVRSDREALSGDERWIYNDLDTGFREARDSGRPLFVTLRCIP